MGRAPVIQVITHLAPGGAQRVVLSLLEGLDRSRFEPHLVAAPRGEWIERAVSIPDCRFHSVTRLVREVSPFNDILATRELFRIFSSIREKAPEGPTIVHTHSPKSGVLGRAAARLARCIPVHTLHGLPYYPAQKPLKRGAYRIFESLGYLFGGELVSVSRANADEVLRRGWVTPDHVHIIAPCTDLGRPAPRTGKRKVLPRYGIGDGERVVSFVASLKAPKDPMSFIEAAGRIAKDYGDLRFLIVGGGPLMGSLKRAAKNLGIGEKTIFTGWFDPIETLYPELDILVLSTFWEGLPLVPVEARASGVPVVASGTGGVREVISDGETGLIVPPGDPVALASAIRRLLDDEALRKRLIEKGLEGLEIYSPESMVNEYERLYGDLARR